MNLIDDASSQWHKLWSMRFIIATAFFTAVIAAYVTLPQDWLPTIPDWVKKTLSVADLITAGAAGISRVIKQPALTVEKTDE